MRMHWLTISLIGGVAMWLVLAAVAHAECSCVCGAGPTPQRICTSSEGISDACWGTCPALPNPIVSTEPGGCRIIADPVTQVPMWKCG
jgi:hypothetical protein